MKIVPLSEINNCEIAVCNVVALEQHWTKGVTVQHMTIPRTSNGLCFFAASGAEYTLYNGKKIYPQAGDVLYLPNYARYAVRFKEDAIDSFLLVFRLYDMDGEEILFDRNVSIALGGQEEMFAELKELCRRYRNAVGDKLYFQARCLSVLNKLSNAAHPADQGNAITPALNRINHHLNEDFDVPSLAAECAMSESTFRRMFRKQTGMTPIRYIHTEKMKKACLMLRDSESSVSEICALLGFYDDAYFCKLFKEYHGVTPAQYRKMR